MKIKIRKDGVLIPKKDMNPKLRKFVEKIDNKYVIIHRLGALYLVEKSIPIGDLNISNYFKLDQLINIFSRYDPYIMSKYLIYRDLIERGYVVKDGYGKGIDLLVYDRGEYPDSPPSIRIIGVEEGDKISLRRLLNEVYMASLNKKQIIIAVIERRGEIVYYKLNEFHLEKL